MSVLVTGGAGFVGRALIPRLLAKGEEVIALARDIDKAKSLLPEGVKIVQGDILLSECGVKEGLPEISAVHHLAAIHQLGPDKEGTIWETNVKGTENVINLCVRHNIPHLYLTSTAYTQGRNVYERSKTVCETMARESNIPRVTIFKPSIIMGTPQHFYPGHVAQFIALLVKVHQRAEVVRRKIEGTLKLPVLEPVFRMKANPGGKLNLISIDDVADAMANTVDTGTFWLTHPNPPTIQEIVDWVSEVIMVRIVITPDFKPTPIEMAFDKMSAPFTPYLWGDDFHSDLKTIPPITREFIQNTVKRTLDFKEV